MIHLTQKTVGFILPTIGSLLLELTLPQSPALAEPIADDTLGAERSLVNRVNPTDVEIEGGAARGANLFHSFQEFDVNVGENVYFLNPAGVENILGRVTGGGRSEILGRLGVRGNANLFLMNPNGILFGENASLDIQGSFIGTTANAIRFGEAGFFSATTPGVPNLLTVAPSAFFFNQLPVARIENRSIAAAGTRFDGFALQGLRVLDGQSLLLVGGDIQLDRGNLNALGGRVELGGLSSTGSVELEETNGLFRLRFPENNSLLANVSIINDAQVLTIGSGGGDIAVHANNFSATDGGQLIAGTLATANGGTVTIDANAVNLSGINTSGLGSGIYSTSASSGDAGDITILAERLNLQNGGVISTSTANSGRSGNINIAAGTVNLTGVAPNAQRPSTRLPSAFYNEAAAGSTGNAGNITISTRQLRLQDGAIISTRPFGSGIGGGLIITATESVEIAGIGRQTAGVFSSNLLAENNGTNASGAITLNTGRLSLQQGGQISTSTRSSGRGGDLNIKADSVEITGVSPEIPGIAVGGLYRSGLGSEAFVGSTGNAGDVTISTRQLSITDGGGISTNTLGQRQGGTLRITATESIDLVGTGTAFTNLGNSSSRGTLGSSIQLDTVGFGSAGTLTLNTGRLSLQQGGQINGRVGGLGEVRGSDLNIIADVIEIVGLSSNNELRSSFTTGTQLLSNGNSGNVNITARQVSLRDGAVISTATVGSGTGGNIDITARESIEVIGSARLNTGQVVNSALATETTGAGASGAISLSTGQLSLQGGGQVSTSTTGAGRGGNQTITADRVHLTGVSSSSESSSSLFSGTFNGSGHAGNITLSARHLNIENGALISTSTFGQGRGGDLTITATESINLVGTGTRVSNTATGTVSSTIGSSLSTSTNGTNAAGTLSINTEQLNIRDGGTINASTSAGGTGGAIAIHADVIELAGLSTDRTLQSNINSTTTGTGNAGSVNIVADQVSVMGGAAISTATGSQGQGGRLRITATDSVTLDGFATLANGQLSSSGLFTSTSGAGNAGELLKVETDQLTIRNGAQINASTSGAGGNAGNIRVIAGSIDLIGNSRNRQFGTGIASEVFLRGRRGNAGNITISGDTLRIRGTATISTGTSGEGNAGDITLRIRGSLALQREGFITSNVFAGSTGNSGEVDIRTGSLSATEGSQISAIVSRTRNFQGNLLIGGQGDGGDITITATDFIRLSGINRAGFSSGILTLSEREANGRAGNITIRTGDLRVQNGAIITASTFNPGDANDITIDANSLELTNGGQIVTSTRDEGFAGIITLDIAGDTLLSGVDPNFENRLNRARRYANRREASDRPSDVVVNQGSASGVFANTERNSTGNGGAIILNTRNLEIRDRATISAQSLGDGEAGSLQLNVGSLEATDSGISTAARRSSGGNITLTGGNIRLLGDSDIQTDSGITGGDISVNASSLVAYDDSDIIAAATERGGNINFGETIAFFENYDPANSEVRNTRTLENNGSADVNATGAEPGNINLVNTDFIQNSLSDLPDAAIDADRLIANSCIARNENGGTFLVTGSGGLPPRPGTAPLSPYPAGTVRIEVDEQPSSSDWQPGDAIVEPQGVYRLPNGQLIISRECS